MKTVNLSQFREDPDNVSEATDEEIARLAEKLRRVPSGLAAMRIAYVTDCPPGCMVISGNKRLRCLKAAFGENGEVPAEYFQDVTSMTPSERHEFRLNANISDGHWNLDRLLEQYGGDELSAAGLEDLLSELSTDEPQATEKTTPPPIARSSATGAAFDFDNPKAESEKNNADNPEYQNFVDKFKPKKTTDDCYTPKIVYDAVADFVAFEYEKDRALFVRPFYPGGDYQAFDYSGGKIVVDNPPFSIMSEILSFYCERKIPFFLFASALTLFSGAAQNHKLTYIVTSANITYANGATVPTSFITNLDSLSGEDDIIQVRADLRELLKKANKENLKDSKKELPKYQFPYCVATSARLGYLAVHGENLSISRDAAAFIRKLDNQEDGNSIFGGGFILSERAAAERAAAERAAAERAAAKCFELSEREKEIQKLLK